MGWDLALFYLFSDAQVNYTSKEEEK